jgi:DNA mismatch endonuclease (patch repair protein)
MDTLSREERSRQMSLVRGKDTRPEWIVRRLLHRLGYRYRLHDRSLPGTPDLVFRSRRQVIFVHGCFWHRHAGCARNRLPKTRVAFWRNKLEGNKLRDANHKRKLTRQGWSYIVVWECELSDPARVEMRLLRFLGARS